MKEKVYKLEGFSRTNILPGNLKRLPDDCFSENTLVFIDAGFLSKLSKYFGNGKYLSYNIIKFSDNLSKKQKLNCKKIFYYTAPPFQSEHQTKEEEIKKEGYVQFVNPKKNPRHLCCGWFTRVFFWESKNQNKLRTLVWSKNPQGFLIKLRDKGVIVREGRCQRLKVDGKFVFGQKGVDSLIIIDLMIVPLYYKEVKKIILIANDSDFVPVVLKLNDLGIESILYTYYSKKRQSSFSRSNDLLKSVSRYVQLIKEDFDNAPLKKEVEE